MKLTRLTRGTFKIKSSDNVFYCLLNKITEDEEYHKNYVLGNQKHAMKYQKKEKK